MEVASGTDISGAVTMREGLRLLLQTSLNPDTGARPAALTQSLITSQIFTNSRPMQSSLHNLSQAFHTQDRT